MRAVRLRNGDEFVALRRHPRPSEHPVTRLHSRGAPTPGTRREKTRAFYPPRALGRGLPTTAEPRPGSYERDGGSDGGGERRPLPSRPDAGVPHLFRPPTPMPRNAAGPPEKAIFLGSPSCHRGGRFFISGKLGEASCSRALKSHVNRCLAMLSAASFSPPAQDSLLFHFSSSFCFVSSRSDKSRLPTFLSSFCFVFLSS